MKDFCGNLYENGITNMKFKENKLFVIRGENLTT